jgi:hypothetical protein
MVESIQKTQELQNTIFGEEEAGIREYISHDNIKIPCVIKHRFSDFIVNEIDENGNVVWFKAETDL